MNPVSAPVETGNGVILQEPGQVAVRCHGCTVDLTPAKPGQILLAEVMVKAPVEFSLMLRVRVVIEGVAVGCRVVWAGRRINRLNKPNQALIDKVGGNDIAGEGLPCERC